MVSMASAGDTRAVLSAPDAMTGDLPPENAKTLNRMAPRRIATAISVVALILAYRAARVGGIP